MAKTPTAILITILAAILLSPAPPAVAQAPGALDPELASLVRKVAEAATAEEAAQGLGKLFGGAERQKLERLKQVKEDGVALRAAWHEILLSGTPRADKHPELGPVQRVDKVAAARFLGFLEGRLGFRIPKLSEECASNAFRAGGDTLLAGEPIENDPPEKIDTKAVNGKTIVRVGKDSLVLPPEIVEKYVKQANFLGTFWDGQDCILVFPGLASYSYSIVCLDRQSGKKVWENTVWASGLTAGFFTGPQWHDVSMVTKGERVFVIGLSGYCLYIEAFDRKTGRGQFRFASRYSSERENERK